MDVWPWGACWLQDEACQFKGLERLEGLRAGKRQAWTPRRSHGCVALGCLLAAGWSMPRDCLSDPEEAIDVWPRGCVALGCLLAAGWSMPRDCLSDPEEAIDVWPRGGCWLQDEACQVSFGRVSQSIEGGLPRQRFKGFKLLAGPCSWQRWIV